MIYLISESEIKDFVCDLIHVLPMEVAMLMQYPAIIDHNCIE